MPLILNEILKKQKDEGLYNSYTIKKGQTNVCPFRYLEKFTITS